MARARREVWTNRVERWLASGLSAREFAAHIGVNANTLANWRWKLRESAAPETASAPTTMAFVEVPRGGVSTREERIELVVARGQVVRVPVDFDEGVLVRLLDVLERR